MIALVYQPLTKEKLMGTYIAYITQKKENDEWVDIEEETFGDMLQSYTIFTFLAGVRREVSEEEIPQIAPLRGMPDDLYPEPEEDEYQGWGYHETQRDIVSHRLGYEKTWYNVTEIISYLDEHPSVKDQVPELYDRAKSLYMTHGNFRIIMGFA